MCKNLSVLSLALMVVPFSSAHEPMTPSDYVKIIQSAEQSIVRVEYTLRYDKGDPPEGGGWRARCPNCGSYHVDLSADVVEEERPLETAGFLIAPTKVITRDPLAHPRFIENIAVRFRDHVVQAVVESYMANQNAIVLTLDQRLRVAKPLSFGGKKERPYFAVTNEYTNGTWTTTAGPLSRKISWDENNNRFIAAPSNCLIVNRLGEPVGMSMVDELPVDESWKGSPLTWPAYSSSEMSAMLSGLRESCGKSIMRVSLSFRSPRRDALENSWGFDEDENATRRNVIGVLIDPGEILVCCHLDPRSTARLEQILVHPPNGDPLTATFLYSLRDYGGFLAKLAKPLDATLKWSSSDILQFRNKLLLSAEIEIQGEQRTAYFMRQRIPSFEIGWHRQIHPEMSVEEEHMFLFTASGNLAALPISRRKAISAQETWDSAYRQLTPTVYLQKAVSEIEKYSDPNNVPVPEDDENRLAWIGVEVQKLDKNLARAHQVAHLTRDGVTGALVSYVYPDSPAMEAGITPGFILLRLYIEGEPKPLEVQLDDYNRYDNSSFSWDDLDQYPAEYFDQIPKPWPSIENSLIRALTDIGFGRKYAAEFFFDGHIIRKNLEIVPSPTHYDSAPRCEVEELGLTIRDLTYETRRYLQKQPGDAGVIISRIESGSKAAVGGLKPYEIITHVNDRPVYKVKDFEKSVEDQQRLRLAVSRMSRERIVQIDLR